MFSILENYSPYSPQECLPDSVHGHLSDAVRLEVHNNKRDHQPQQPGSPDLRRLLRNWTSGVSLQGPQTVPVREREVRYSLQGVLRIPHRLQEECREREVG